MTDTEVQEMAQAIRSQREMKRAMTALLDRLSDRVHELFPWDGSPNTAQHDELYDAIGSALNAVKYATIGTPAKDAFRRTVFGFVAEAFELVQGSAEFDAVIGQAITICEADNKPDTPLSRQRKDAAPAAKSPGNIKTKEAGK